MVRVNERERGEEGRRDGKCECVMLNFFKQMGVVYCHSTVIYVCYTQSVCVHNYMYIIICVVAY